MLKFFFNIKNELKSLAKIMFSYGFKITQTFSIRKETIANLVSGEETKNKAHLIARTRVDQQHNANKTHLYSIWHNQFLKPHNMQLKPFFSNINTNYEYP